MRQFLFVCALPLALLAAPTSSQDTFVNQASTIIRSAQCTVAPGASDRRVVGSCETREAAAALKEQLRTIAGGRALYGPLCSFTVSEPRQVIACEVQVERRS